MGCCLNDLVLHSLFLHPHWIWVFPLFLGATNYFLHLHLAHDTVLTLHSSLYSLSSNCLGNKGLSNLVDALPRLSNIQEIK